MIDQLSSEEQTFAVDAAHVFAQKLYGALESIYEKYPAHS